MCIFKQPKAAKPMTPTAEPEETAEPTEIGAARKAEDEALFGGEQSLRVNTDTVGQGAVAGGTGLRMM